MTFTIQYFHIKFIIFDGFTSAYDIGISVNTWNSLNTPRPPPPQPPPLPPYGHDKGIFCYLKSVVIILDFKHSKHAINK